MNVDEFQKYCTKGTIYPKEPAGMGIVYSSVGLMGEAGEVANEIKKILRDDSGLLTTESCSRLRSEIGDVLFYLAILADELGENLSDICLNQMAKLDKKRAEWGMSR